MAIICVVTCLLCFFTCCLSASIPKGTCFVHFYPDCYNATTTKDFKHDLCSFLKFFTEQYCLNANQPFVLPQVKNLSIEEFCGQEKLKSWELIKYLPIDKVLKNKTLCVKSCTDLGKLCLSLENLMNFYYNQTHKNLSKTSIPNSMPDKIPQIRNKKPVEIPYKETHGNLPNPYLTERTSRKLSNDNSNKSGVINQPGSKSIPLSSIATGVTLSKGPNGVSKNIAPTEGTLSKTNNVGSKNIEPTGKTLSNRTHSGSKDIAPTGENPSQRTNGGSQNIKPTGETLTKAIHGGAKTFSLNGEIPAKGINGSSKNIMPTGETLSKGMDARSKNIAPTGETPSKAIHGGAKNITPTGDTPSKGINGGAKNIAPTGDTPSKGIDHGTKNIGLTGSTPSKGINGGTKNIGLTGETQSKGINGGSKNIASAGDTLSKGIDGGIKNIGLTGETPSKGINGFFKNIQMSTLLYNVVKKKTSTFQNINNDRRNYLSHDSISNNIYPQNILPQFDDDQQNSFHVNEISDSKNRNTNQEKSLPTEYNETPSSAHFMGYFLTAIVLCIAGYVVFHNKQKIIAFIIEGRNQKRSRRPNAGEYKKLQTNVDDVMSSLEKSTKSTNYIY